MKPKDFKFGEKTKNIWSGDFVIECEFIQKLPNGNLVFFSPRTKYFILAFYEVLDGRFILNGWNSADTIEKLLKIHQKL